MSYQMRHWTLHVHGINRMADQPDYYDHPYGNVIVDDYALGVITGKLQNAAWDAEHKLELMANGEIAWGASDGDPVFVVSSYFWPSEPADDQTQEGNSDGE
jgi:hypothetical protein